MKRIVMAAGLILLGIAAPALADDPIAPEFRKIEADKIERAKIWLPEIWPKSDLVPSGNYFVAKRSPGVEPERAEKYCDLTADQIAAILDIVKRAHPLSTKSAGIGAWMVIQFQPRDGKPFVAVIGSPLEDYGGDVPIFLNKKDAALRPAGRAALGRIATDAGCTP